MVRYDVVQHGTIWYSTVQYSTVQYGTVQYSTNRYGRCSGSRWSVVIGKWITPRWRHVRRLTPTEKTIHSHLLLDAARCKHVMNYWITMSLSVKAARPDPLKVYLLGKNILWLAVNVIHSSNWLSIVLYPSLIGCPLYFTLLWLAVHRTFPLLWLAVYRNLPFSDWLTIVLHSFLIGVQSSSTCLWLVVCRHPSSLIGCPS